MYNIQIHNCNNIKNGTVRIEPNKLNIKYGINGTGKTTIANAIKYSVKEDKLQDLQSYYSTDKASIEVSPKFNKILVFNEEFINQVVFVEDEVIENSFEVFLKTPDYEAKKRQLDEHLKILREIVVEDSEIVDLKNKLMTINGKFSRTSTGKLSTTGVLKSLLSKQNLYNIARKSDINIVSRVAFLRKLCELNGRQGEWGEAYEILSCLVHASGIRRKLANDTYVDMDDTEIESGMSKIKEFIPGFDFEEYKDSTYAISGIKTLYECENNAYLKIQLFRAICEIAGDTIKLSPFDDGWYKFIDETYHIENDYLHYLDILKFNIVPNYISNKVEEMMSKP